MREADIRPKPLLDEFFARLKRDADRLAVKRPSFVPVDCSFCGSAQSVPAFDKDGFPYRTCAQCGSLFASPRPTPADLMEYAMTSEAVAYWSSHFYKETAEARRAKMFRPRAELTVATAARYGMTGAIRAADVGAGYGLFLQELAALAPSWQLTAIEPDARLAGICRELGYRVDPRWVEDIDDGELQMDVIAAFEVIEHVFDPAAFLAGCRRLLRPGGIAIVTTLTISGFDLVVLGPHSRSITPPQHLNFPSVDAVPLLAARAGLEVLDVSTPGQLDVDIVRNVIGERPEAVSDSFARQIAAADESTRQHFQQFLQQHRMSSHLRCVLRRP